MLQYEHILDLMNEEKAFWNIFGKNNNQVLYKIRDTIAEIIVRRGLKYYRNIISQTSN
jgi:hypothetical protein